MQSVIKGSRVRKLQIKESRKIPLTIGIRNPSSMRIQYQYLESAIYGVVSRIYAKLSKLSWITLHVVTNQKVPFIPLILNEYDIT